nr:diacylglycerol kinase family protein [Bifidobacterium aemilianum]
MASNVIIVIAAAVIAGALVLVIAAALVSRTLRRRRRARAMQSRNDDQVHYAFIINPSKPQAAQHRRHIELYCHAHNLTQVEYIETQLDKDGRACAQEALAHGAQVLVAVGGDGTVRTVASALSGTGHPLGIIPIGTGNLFARNMGIPVDDMDTALAVATSHGSRMVDVGRLSLLDRPDDDHGHAFLIIAGIGFDALMIDDTDPELKKSISWLAYFASGSKHIFGGKYHARVTIENEDGSSRTIQRLTFRTFMAGNCGQIPIFSLMPNAVYDDGLLDFEIIDTTSGILGWAGLFADIVHQTITRKAQKSPISSSSTIDQLQGVSADIKLEKPALAEVDGDMLGETCHIRFTIEHKALCVRVPTETELAMMQAGGTVEPAALPAQITASVAPTKAPAANTQSTDLADLQ